MFLLEGNICKAKVWMAEASSGRTSCYFTCVMYMFVDYIGLCERAGIEVDAVCTGYHRIRGQSCCGQCVSNMLSGHRSL